MASAHSILRNYGEYVQPYDLHLMQQGLAYKQQKFDANVEKVQSQIDQLVQIDLARDVDRQYLNDRMQILINKANEYGQMDLSNNSVTKNMQGYISQALDDKVMNAYRGTKKLRQFQSEVEKAKEAGDGSYSVQNHAFGMQEAMKWFNNPKAGEVYHGGSYTPFTNVRQISEERIRERIKNLPEQVTKIPDGNGHMIEVKNKDLTASEIRIIAQQSLTAQEKAQLQIDGWYNWSRAGEEQVEEVFNQYVQDRTAKYQGEVDAINAVLEGEVSAGQRKHLEKQLIRKQAALKSVTDGAAKVPQDVNSRGYYLESENLFNGLSEQFEYSNYSESYSNDVAYWNAMDLKYRRNKDAIENKKWKAEFEQRERFHGDDMAAKAAKAAGKGTPSNPEDITVTSVVTPSEQEEFDFEKNAVDQVKTSGSMRDQYINEVYGNFSQEHQKLFNSTLESRKKDKEFKGMSEADLRYRTMVDLSNNGQNTAMFGDGNNLAMAQAEEHTRRVNMEFINNVAKTRREGNLAAGQNLIDSANKYERIKMMDENGQVVSAKDYLAKHGIKTNEDLAAKPEVRNQLFARATVGRVMKESRRTDASGNRHFLDNDVAKRAIASLGGFLGEDVTFEDVFEVTTTKRNTDVIGSVDAKTIRLRDNNPKAQKTIDYIRKTQEQQMYDASFGTDDFTDIRSSREAIDSDMGNQMAKDYIAKHAPKLPQNNRLGFAPGSAEHTYLLRKAEAADVRFRAEDDVDITLETDPENPDYYIVKQSTPVSIAQRRAGASPHQEARILKREVQGSPVAQAVDLKSGRSSFSPSVAVPLNFQGYFADDHKQADYLGTLVSAFPGNMDVVKSSQIESYRILSARHYSMFQDEEGKTSQTGRVINHAIQNAGEFEVKTKPSPIAGMRNISLVYTGNGPKRTVVSFNRPEEAFNENLALYRRAPQILVHDAFDYLLEQEKVWIDAGQKDYRSDSMNVLYSMYENQTK